MADTIEPNIFAYWDRDDRSPIATMIDHWRAAFPSFRMLADSDVVPLLEARFGDLATLYTRLRLPAARADIARLAGLVEWGGLYVDCKCAIRDLAGIRGLFDRLGRIEAIFIDCSHTIRPRPAGSRHLINGIIAARPRVPLFIAMLERAMRNLAWQAEAEAKEGFVEYDLAMLAGAYVLTALVCVPGSANRETRPELAGRIEIIPEGEAPVWRDWFPALTVPKLHWNERQRHEPLFIPAP